MLKRDVTLLLLVIWLLLLSPVSAVADDSLGRVTGRVYCQEQSGCIGVASLWKVAGGAVPDPRKYTAIPIIVSPLQADGVFELQAPPGDYYLGAFLRASPGPKMGPPRKGDHIFLTPDPAGRPNIVRVLAGKTADAGIHSVSWRFAGMTEPEQTGVSGQLVDVNLKPVAGLLVFAFADAELSVSPLAVSTRSDATGAFILQLPKPGTIYLRARRNYRGGQPLPGDYVGVFGGAVPKPLALKQGKPIRGLRLIVRQVPQRLQRKNAPDTSRPQFRAD